jgi:pimeloyl-ACP methyl ester carboxylesterase
MSRFLSVQQNLWWHRFSACAGALTPTANSFIFPALPQKSYPFSSHFTCQQVHWMHTLFSPQEEAAMAAAPTPNYAALDLPDVLLRLFHPRPESPSESPTTARELLIPAAPGVVLGARWYSAAKDAPTLLFFHGNGEIVADYEELGPLYVRLGFNFFPVDYRGYGRSTGSPSVSSMMLDCRTIFTFADDWLKKEGFTGPLVVMGRSLGSAAALELAALYQDQLSGLIVESGFAYATPLLQLLGVNVADLGFVEEKGFRQVDKIRQWVKPLLIIHAEFDHIIPYAEGQALFEACPSTQKTLLKVPGANHNNILSVGFDAYMKAVARLGGVAVQEKAR